MVECREGGCRKGARYGFLGRTLECCKKHKDNGMINPHSKKENVGELHDTYKFIFSIIDQVINKSIQIIDKKDRKIARKLERERNPKYPCNKCGVKATYNFRSENNPIRCKDHKDRGMVLWSARSSLCRDITCERSAQYNFPGEKARYCYDHSDPGMIIVTSKRCEGAGCKFAAIFDIPGGKGRFCKKHKKPNMINVQARECADPTCRTSPSFNFKGLSAMFCSKHKGNGMIDVTNATCIAPGCEERAIYSNKRRKPMYCALHKDHDMIIGGVVKHCQECNIVIEKSYKSYCKTCYFSLHADESTYKRNVREQCVAEYVCCMIDDYDIVLDEHIKGGMSKHRPDIMIDVGTHIVIVEVDENQHKMYSSAHEENRLAELYKDGGKRPLYVIRFNPDGYIGENGCSVVSCWNSSKYDGACLKKNKQEEWMDRLDVLTDYILGGIYSEMEKDIEVKYLFYDGWSP